MVVCVSRELKGITEEREAKQAALTHPVYLADGRDSEALAWLLRWGVREPCRVWHDTGLMHKRRR